MSARPSWLTDAMLDEMRLLEGTSSSVRRGVGGANIAVLDSLADAMRESASEWASDWVLSTTSDRTHVYLTPAGHKALAAIEAESAGKTVPTTPKFIYESKDGRVVRTLNPLHMVPTMEPPASGEYAFPGSKPCANCDRGHGPSGLTMFGMRCSVCDGAKVVG